METGNENDWGVNLDMIIKDGSRYILAQDMATLIKMNGLITVGTLLKSIEDDKLQTMINFIEETFQDEDPGDHTCHEELMLLALMMVQAEGGQIGIDPDEAIKYMNSTMMYLMMESLSRKGLIELKHENISFDEAVANRVVAKATDAGKDFVRGDDDSDD